VRKYTKSHEWIEYYPERKVARVGISNYAQQQLGEIIHVEFPSVGKSLNGGDSTVVIESVKVAADVYSPVEGKVTALNQEVSGNPSLVNDEAEKAWLFEISYNQEAAGLLTPEEYAKIAVWWCIIREHKQNSIHSRQATQYKNFDQCGE